MNKIRMAKAPSLMLVGSEFGKRESQVQRLSGGNKASR